MNDRHLQHIARLRKQGKTKEALRLFEEAVFEPGANAVLHLEYGYMLDSLSREARAITQYNKALTLGLPPSDRVSFVLRPLIAIGNATTRLSLRSRGPHWSFRRIRSLSVFTL